VICLLVNKGRWRIDERSANRAFKGRQAKPVFARPGRWRATDSYYSDFTWPRRHRSRRVNIAARSRATKMADEPTECLEAGSRCGC